MHDVENVSQFDHRRVFPFSYPVYQTRLLPNLSFSNDIPTAFREGNVVVLKGTTSGNPSGSLTLKFLVGKSEAQSFHMDVRFSEKKVFRNNSVNDGVEWARFKSREKFWILSWQRCFQAHWSWSWILRWLSIRVRENIQNRSWLRLGWCSSVGEWKLFLWISLQSSFVDVLGVEDSRQERFATARYGAPAFQNQQRVAQSGFIFTLVKFLRFVWSTKTELSFTKPFRFSQ